jgi:hypothetical protein
MLYCCLIPFSSPEWTWRFRRKRTHGKRYDNQINAVPEAFPMSAGEFWQRFFSCLYFHGTSKEQKHQLATTTIINPPSRNVTLPQQRRSSTEYPVWKLARPEESASASYGVWKNFHALPAKQPLTTVFNQEMTWCFGWLVTAKPE